MRQAMARGAALGTGLVVTGAVALFAFLQQRGRGGESTAPGAMSGGESQEPSGWRGQPAGGRGLCLWIVAPQAMRPGIRKPAYDDLGNERLQALVAYLMYLTD